MDRHMQLLLNDSSRDGAGRTKAKRAVKAAGLELTGEGYVSLSARISDQHFAALFGCEPEAVPDELGIPDALAPYFASVTEAPQHEYMSKKGYTP